jgi:alpha-amylase/alpha-mannosidase (GH57 family)
VDRYICVHGHFYQPPRENPWLEVVERQDAAWPYHDWNERITAECYGPNTAARILDDDGRITGLVNNYARMSFNVGPTLLAWLEREDPETYRGILDADRDSAERFGGHGSAMAQVYNHVIMPLASPRDRETQVRWGIADFRARFGRDPEGMWLAEAAADVDTLEVLADHGLAFTVLSPFQAARVRAPGGDWEDVGGGHVLPTRPYRVALPSGRRIAVFFYDGPISQAVAFEGLLSSGELFAKRLREGFHDGDGPQLVNIATDGESYGHHHRHGEMALAHTLQLLDRADDVRLTNYGEYLELHPPTHEAEIVSPSSWSCAHGVERWRADCGCTTGGEPGWNQAWRAPLREALDWLRDELAPRFERAAAPLLRDPWVARDDYIELVLDRRPGTVDAFLRRHARRRLDAPQRIRVLSLLEMQRHALLMYTSCGWFFEELSRIETVQVLSYAARALQLAREHAGAGELYGGFRERLEPARSNLPQLHDGRTIFELQVEPAVTDLEKVAAHVAIAGLFRRDDGDRIIGCYDVERQEERVAEAGRSRMAFGCARVRSQITGDEADFEYGVVHLGDHNFSCGVKRSGDPDAFADMAAQLDEAFGTADVPELIRVLDEHFGGHAYSLRDLFKDEQARILGIVLDTTMADVEAAYRSIYRGRAPLLRFLAGLQTGIPAPLRSAAEVVINTELREVMSRDADPTRVRSLIEEAERLGLELDLDGLGHAVDETIRRTAETIAARLGDPEVFDRFGSDEEQFFRRIRQLVEVAGSLPLGADLGRAQHVAYRAVHGHRPALAERAAAGDAVARRWLEHLDAVARDLRIAIPR